MTNWRLLTRSLVYYWRTNLAVLLGVVAGTAVIGGALVVGDSVRDSLRQMSLDRLGEIDHVLRSQRFFRQQLADELARQPEFQQRFAAVAPALLMTGSLEHNQNGAIRRANELNVYGVGERLWKLTEHGNVDVPTGDTVVLSHRLADQLGVTTGDDVTLWIELPTSIPRESPLGERDEMSREILLKVTAVLEEVSGVGRLAMNPNQQLPLNVFVPLDTLQRNLDLQEIKPSRRNPKAAPARVNTLFVQAKADNDRTGETAPIASEALTGLLAKNLQLADLSLRLVSNKKLAYLALESEQMILEDVFAAAAESTATQMQLVRSSVLVYLANEIRRVDAEGVEREQEPGYSMYSVIAGLDFSKEPPFGPFEFVGNPIEGKLGRREIVLNDWLANDVNAAIGDKISVKYHVVGSHGELPELEERFTVRGIVKLTGPAADRGLTPELAGITDADTFDDWDQPFPMKLPVPALDEEYWNEHKATPKAFLSLETAQELWPSRYGAVTAVRVAKLANKTLDETANEFKQSFLASLEPERTGLVFQPVKYNGLQAASGTTDFSGLFILFSFFLILSATILIALLFRLGIERRGTSVGLLSAVGLAPNSVRRLFLTEGLVVVCLGGLIGVAAAVGYAALMVAGLKSPDWWYGAIGTKFLFVSVRPLSLVLGFAISVVVASLAVWWSIRQFRGLSTRELLTGLTERELTSEAQSRRGHRAARVGTISTAIAILLTVGSLSGIIPASEAFSGISWKVAAFFVVGNALLVASLSFLSAWLDSDRSAAVRGSGAAGMGRLGMRNASRHRQRSVFTVGLIASATFVIVAVAAGHRNPAAEIPDKNSGNGGFWLVAQTSTPILYDLNTTDGRDKLDLSFEQGSREAKLIDEMHVVSFREKPGEEASCLNLYQTRLPTLLGVSERMIERGGFKFADTKADNPWKLLTEKHEPEQVKGRVVDVIPVLGDMNTLMYSLHRGIGKTIGVPDDENPEYKLKIVGMFDGSVFQGVLLMSDENFRNLYRNREGYEYFLIGNRNADAAAYSKADVDKLSTLLETGLSAYGFDAELVSDRLANFLAVQNTYLSTFQTLGGLGLLLGTLGLATVMLRNVLERRSELALLRAVGFRNSSVAWLVLWENAFLLLWGLTAGTISALLAMTPHLMSTGADVPWKSGGLMLGGVFLIGMAAALLAVTEAVRTPIVATLRSE